ncbi:MAG: hypothetical protein QGG64_10410, partial [Candidatus Latescibacteria bacterium]|nr:hypothetical protein [Candidatus Latescibacterota bacterium]
EMLQPHLSTWTVLSDEGLAATWFYEGLPPGQPIPWVDWFVPLFWWGTLVGAIGISMLCLMMLLRKQWVENERLEYPLMTVGLKLATEPDGEDGIFVMINNRGFRFAFFLGFLAVGWNIVHYFVPLVPSLPTVPTSGTWFRWLERAPTFWVQISIYILGFAYFARVEALFSFWVFFVLAGIEINIFDRLGVGSSVGQGGVEAVRAQSFGALCAMTLTGLWMARHHLCGALKKALGRASDVDDAGEVLTFRTAFLGMIASVIYIAGWLHLAGFEWRVLGLYLTFAFLAYIGLSRIVAEVGLPYANISDTALNWTPFYILGARNIAASTMVGQGLIYSLFATTRGFLGPPIAQILKLTSGLHFRRHRLVLAIVLALGVGFAVSVFDTIYLSYTHGGYNMGAWSMVTGSQNAYQTAVTWIRNPKPPDWDRLTFMGSGVIITLVLTYLKYRLTWWPLPAVGFALQGMYMARRIVFPVFLMWAYKTIILKVGGVQLYRKGQPFFIGLMVGYAVGVFFSSVMDQMFFWGRGHSVHDF